METIICRCGERVPCGQWPVRRDGSRATRCRGCLDYAAERNRRWREANKEKEAERNRRWREANKEKVAERGCRYRARKKQQQEEAT